MAKKLRPIPDGKARAEMAKRVRIEAANVAFNRAPPPVQKNNEAETEYSPALYTFTKGLTHDAYGCATHGDLDTLITEINQDRPGSALGETPFPGTYSSGCPAPFSVTLAKDSRTLESPLAGHTMDTNGPDADALAMPPAPDLGSDELIAEIAEVYAMALVRDVPFSAWMGDQKIQAVLGSLNQLAFFKSADGLDRRAKIRRAARFNAGATQLTPMNLFRGSTPGAQYGDYISTFMLGGNDHPAGLYTQDHGRIVYGAQSIQQSYAPHLETLDYMTDLTGFLRVQDGDDRRGTDQYETAERFVTTPRDLATYVHVDQLYQAYLNACLILLGQKHYFDAGLPEGGFGDNKAAAQSTRDAFATFGGPHVLTLVTEVATRALKAVRRQKFNIHLRARPEALAGALSLAWGASDHPDPATRQELRAKLGNTLEPLTRMVDQLKLCGLLQHVRDHNKQQNETHGRPVTDGWLDESVNALLPMAFPEGSPMHPAYGAGHATVAGACVTILKAFFEMYDLADSDSFKGNMLRRGKLNLKKIMNDPDTHPGMLFPDELTLQRVNLKAFEAQGADGKTLKHTGKETSLTIQHELDKLAANIAIGRDFAGVHYYTDYYESLRLGERIAAGLLQEHMLTYREPVSVRFTSFDGEHVIIYGTGGSRGGNDTGILIWSQQGSDWEAVDFVSWWHRGAEGLAH